MKHESKVQFKSAQTDLPALTMLDAITAAKSAVEAMPGHKVDSIVQCTPADQGTWAITVDVIESYARLGDNDLLAAYQVRIGTASELLQFERLKRYHREDNDT